MCLAVLREIWIFFSLFCFVFVAFICICAGAANQAGSIKSLASACGPTLPERQGEIHLASEGPSGQVVMARSGPATENGKRQERSGEGEGGFRAGVCTGGVPLGGGGGEKATEILKQIDSRKLLI